MNRRQLLTAGAAGVAGLLVPSVAVANRKRQTLQEYVLSLPQETGDNWRRWLVHICHIDPKWGKPIRLRYCWYDSGSKWICLHQLPNTNYWLYTADGPKLIDPKTTELLPYKPVVGSLEECYSPVYNVGPDGGFVVTGVEKSPYIPYDCVRRSL